ncbi:MAG: RNA methyltransferase [Bacteroidota bacterium]
MLSKNKIKYLRALKLKKFRQKYNKFSVEGEKIVAEMVRSQNVEIETIIATKAWHQQYFNETLARKINIEVVGLDELKKVSSLTTPSSVLAVASPINSSWHNPLIQNSFTLFLDDIQDPGNMGTMLRIADWFGIPYVFCSEGCVDVYNPKTLQSSMGAFLRVKTLTISFDDLFRRCASLPFYGTVLDGENIFQKREFQKGVIVMGNEGKGIADDILKKLTHQVGIPKGKQGGAESLNVAVATGIVCAILTHSASSS